MKNQADLNKLWDVSQQQRGEPEMAMLRIQHYTNGGALSYVCEHCGDIQHRMCTGAKWNSNNKHEVQDKVKKVLNALTTGYGFERDYTESFTRVMREKGAESIEQEFNKLDAMLQDFSREHAKLKAYNLPHWVARQANIELGYKRFKETIKYLRLIQKMLDDGTYDELALTIQDPSGKFKPTRKMLSR